MGLDVYVGSLTRYYCRDWETIVQQMARGTGKKVEVVRVIDNAQDANDDPDQVRAAVLAWRAKLAEALKEVLVGGLDWREDDEAPYFTDKPAWDCYGDLLLWAAYEENPDLPRPEKSVEAWSEDPAYTRSNDKDAASRYPNLVKGVEVWLPADFSFTFRGPDAGGEETTFGSSAGLQRELELLNDRTWKADDAALQAWRKKGSESGAPLESGARFALAVLMPLVRQANAERLVVKLDF
ncbi:MAG: hypothetical protein O7E54_09445 [Planctomycetota bacterium]|nr:hypothetical protein [Planctomycetota bacterium]